MLSVPQRARFGSGGGVIPTAAQTAVRSSTAVFEHSSLSPRDLHLLIQPEVRGGASRSNRAVVRRLVGRRFKARHSAELKLN